MPIENIKFVDNYYYKFSKINGEYPNKENEPYISSEHYLNSKDLSKKETYLEKLKWGETNYDYEILKEDKYPILKHNKQILEGQEGINLPIDPIRDDSIESVGNVLVDQNQDLTEELQYTFNYNGKIIRIISFSSIFIIYTFSYFSNHSTNVFFCLYCSSCVIIRRNRCYILYIIHFTIF